MFQNLSCLCLLVTLPIIKKSVLCRRPCQFFCVNVFVTGFLGSACVYVRVIYFYYLQEKVILSVYIEVDRG